jgi:hypothetical protein
MADSRWALSRQLDPLKVLSPEMDDPKLKGIWQDAVNVFWPLELHVPMKGQEPLVWAFFKHCLGDILLFNCMSSVLASLHNSRIGTTNHTPLMLQYQNRAIRLLRYEVADRKYWRDEFLFALLCMTPGEPDPLLVADPRPYGGFTPIARHMQYLKSNGLLRWSRPHKVALATTLQQRGGIATIGISGVAELMQANDLVECSHTLWSPTYPLCSSYQIFLATEVCRVREEYRTSCQGHCPLTVRDVGLKLYDFIWDMRAYVEMLTGYAPGSLLKVEMPHLATHRNLIQYRLLSGDLEDDTCPLSRLISLASKIFTYGVIYPLPDRKPQLELAAQLRVTLEQYPVKIDDDLRTWVLVLGGIATAAVEGQAWYSAQLAHIYQKQISVDSQTLQKEIMKKMHGFVWMDAACNDGFLNLWSEVEHIAQASAYADSSFATSFVVYALD